MSARDSRGDQRVHLLQGDRPAAKRLLEAAMNACPKAFLEWSGAEAELRRLEP